MFWYAQLDKHTGAAFAGLTYERFRPWLKGEHDVPGTVAFGAYALWQPVGLLVGYLNAEKKQAVLYSLTVLPAHQNQGVGTALVNLFEGWLREHGCEGVEAQFVGENPALARVFAKNSWPHPEIFGYAVESNPDVFIHAPIFQNPPTLPPGYALFLWPELTPEEREAIQARDAQPGGWYSAYPFGGSVNPFVEESLIEAECSVGLRYEGAVIGWMIVHRLSENTIHLISLFLSPEHRGKALGLSLVIAASTQVVKVYGGRVPPIHGYWQFRAGNKVMEAMVTQYLAPYSIETLKEYKTYKNLTT